MCCARRPVRPAHQGSTFATRCHSIGRSPSTRERLHCRRISGRVGRAREAQPAGRQTPGPAADAKEKPGRPGCRALRASSWSIISHCSVSICDPGEPPGDGRPGFEPPSRPTPVWNAMASSAAEHIVQGNLLVGQGQFDRAVAEYTEAIRIEPRSALAYMGRGVARAKAGQVKQAIADQTEAIRIQPDLAAAFRNRGRDHWTRGAVKSALAHFAE